MAITSEIGVQLYRRYQLESELLHWEQRENCLREELPNRKYEMREAEAAVLAYESGVRKFLDKLTGKWEEKQEHLRQKVSVANAAFTLTQEDLKVVAEKKQELLSQLEPLRQLGDVVEAVQEAARQERELLLLLEARLRAKGLLCSLEKGLEALTNAQEWARPHNRLEAVPGMQKSVYLSEADRYAEESRIQLERIAQCGILLDIHPYFTNPAGYICGVAAEYAQLDRINRALDAIRDTLRQAKELLVQLPEEDE